MVEQFCAYYFCKEPHQDMGLLKVYNAPGKLIIDIQYKNALQRGAEGYCTEMAGHKPLSSYLPMIDRRYDHTNTF